jgi:hypothetical protein
MNEPLPCGARPPALRDDERGAILVLGVFMCACMVAVLWYLAGIADAVLYRERLQEAADATVFSAAALNARGMNLIVLLNLIMASVLAVRVALKALQAGLALAGVILLFIPGGQPASTASFNGAAQMQRAITATRNPINQTLKALSKAQKGIAMVVPAAAIVGSVQVGTKYRPTVSFAAAGNPFQGVGLPVTEGSPERLCGEAAGAVIELLALFMPEGVRPFVTGFAGSKINNMIKKAVGKGQIYFCELGLGAPPDFASEIESGAKEGCGKQQDNLNDAASSAASRYNTQCQQFGVVCNGSEGSDPKLTPAQKATLSGLRATRDQAQSAAGKFDKDTCIKDAKKDGQRQLDDKSGDGTKDPNAKAPNSKDPNTGKPSTTKPATTKPSVSPQEMTPKKITPDFQNGNARGQVISIVRGNDRSLQIAPSAVKIGAWGKKVNLEAPATAHLGFAQAEFFYDCQGPWRNEQCNGVSQDGNVMWHFRWRPRLRLFNAPFGRNASGGPEAFLEAITHASTFAKAFNPNAIGTVPLGSAYAQLLDAMKGDLILH